MKRPTRPEADPAQALRRAALQYPEAHEGIACAGTALERRTVTVRGKAFLFVGTADARLKLNDSLVEATRLAATEPGRYQVGAHGWVAVTFGDVESLPVALLVRWIGESYRLLAPKQLTATLLVGSPPAELGSATPKRKARTKGPK